MAKKKFQTVSVIYEYKEKISSPLKKLLSEILFVYNINWLRSTKVS